MCCSEPKILTENFTTCSISLQKYRQFNFLNYAHATVRTLVEQEYVYVISGFGDIWGCGCRFLSRGVGMAEPCSEEFVQESDVAEL